MHKRPTALKSVCYLAGITYAESPEMGRELFFDSGKVLLDVVTRDVRRVVTIAALLRVWAATYGHAMDGVWRVRYPRLT